jgi:hypothetical protein
MTRRKVASGGVPTAAPRLVPAEQKVRDEEGPAGSPERIATARCPFAAARGLELCQRPERRNVTDRGTSGRCRGRDGERLNYGPTRRASI